VGGCCHHQFQGWKYENELPARSPSLNDGVFHSLDAELLAPPKVTVKVISIGLNKGGCCLFDEG
jgi:hypothetical protein